MNTTPMKQQLITIEKTFTDKNSKVVSAKGINIE